MMEEIDSLRQRLAESERIQHTLRDERHGFDQEIAYWKARVAEAEVNSRRLAALQEPFKQLLAKQASLEERHREYQEALANFSQLVAMPNVNAQPSATFDEFQAAVPVIEMRDGAVENQAPESVPAVVTLKNVVAAQGAQKPKRQFGVIPAVIVLAFAGALAAGLWGMKANDTPEPAPVTAGALPARNQNQAPVSIATTPAPDVTEPPVTPHIPAAKAPTPTAVKEKNEPAKPIQVAKPQQPVTGTYEITRSSRVHVAPSEFSESMGEIEPGVRVNVVNSKNGWLEIHSKHGRPPGFIRKEGARLAAQN